MVLTVIGIALCISGLLLIQKARKTIEVEGFQRTDIGSMGDLRVRLQKAEERIISVGAEVINAQIAIKQMMHSGEMPALRDAGSVPARDRSYIT